MTIWYRTRTRRWTARAAIVAGLFAVLLVAAVPAALLTGVILMLLGHVVVGLALFGAFTLVAAGAIAAVVIAGRSGLRRLRKFVDPRGYRVVQLGQGEYDFN